MLRYTENEAPLRVVEGTVVELSTESVSLNLTRKEAEELFAMALNAPHQESAEGAAALRKLGHLLNG